MRPLALIALLVLIVIAGSVMLLVGPRTHAPERSARPDAIGEVLAGARASGAPRAMHEARSTSSEDTPSSAPDSSEVALAAESSPDETARIAGVVLGSDDRPLQLAWVSASAERAWNRDVATDALGRFELRVAAGEYELVASADAHVDSAPIVLTLAEGEELTGLTVRLEGAGGIEGKVEALIARSSSRSVLIEGESLAEEVLTDADGRFRAHGIPPGSYQVWAYPTFDEAIELLSDHSESVELALRRSASVEVRAGEVTSVLIDAEQLNLVQITWSVYLDGELAPESDLWAVREELGHSSRPWRNRAESIRLLPGEWDIHVDVRGGDIPIHLRFREEIPAEPRHHIEVRLKTGSLSGSVTTLAGDPIARAEVALSGPSDAPSVQGSVATDALGRYAVHGLPAGTYDVSVRDVPEGRLNRVAPSFLRAARGAVIVAAGADAGPIDFALGPGGGVRIWSRAPERNKLATRLLLSGTNDEIELHYTNPGQWVGIGIAPGRYRLTILEGPLVLAGSAQLVDVRVGELTVVALDLAEGSVR